MSTPSRKLAVPWRCHSVQRRLKRALDLIVAATGLLVLAPLLLGLGLLVRQRLGAPALFVQQRPGQGGRPFRIVKLRTMRDTCGPDGRSLPDAQRLTPLGRWLRAASLDELPELWNVLKGEMSLVGPRPLLMEYLPLYDDKQWRRHEMPPGMTGWAVIHGRNALTWEAKFRLDVWYVDHWSIGLDLIILLRTIGQVLRRTGINHAGEATMPPFSSDLADGEKAGATLSSRQANRI